MQPSSSQKASKSDGTRPGWVPETLFPFTSRWLQVGAARLHYVDEGSGPTLLMIAGTPMWSFMYRYPISKLSAAYRCVAVDLPGLGLSDAPVVPGQAFSTSADLLQQFVQKLDLREIIMVVHATAGPPAFEMASREHERISGFVISNSFAWPPADKAPAKQFVRVISSSPFRALNFYFNLMPKMAIRVARRKAKFSESEKAAILGPFQRNGPRLHLKNFLLGVRVERPLFQAVETHLKALRDKRALLLYGVQEPGYKAGFLDKWQKALPRHKVVLFNESGHYLLEDEPERYTMELRRWLDDFKQADDQNNQAKL
jgi:haloalkane dehalogenase